jgi:hypothetical protein
MTVYSPTMLNLPSQSILRKRDLRGNDLADCDDGLYRWLTSSQRGSNFAWSSGDDEKQALTLDHGTS